MVATDERTLASAPALAPSGSGALALKIVAKEPVADGVVALTLAKPDGARLPDWTPGAHIELTVPGGADATPLTRHYSLCGDRWDAHTYRIAVLRERASRGGSAYVHDVLQEGDRIEVGAPRNHFPLVPATRYLFIAGGIGITPLIPMLHQAELLGAAWQLLYGGRTRASMAFSSELAAAYGERVHLAPQDECGHLDLGSWLSPARADTLMYCCGPAPLLTAVERACAAWPDHTLRTERFSATALQAPARTTPFELELRKSGITVTVPTGGTVLDAMRAAGVDVLSSCRQGVCGTCLSPVLAGEPDHRDALLSDHEREAGNRMLVCVSRSRTDRLVLDL